MPCSLLKVNWRFRETHGLYLNACFMLVPCLSYSSSLKTEAIYCSETLTDFQLTTRRYISEDRTLYNNCWEKSQILQNWIWMVNILMLIWEVDVKLYTYLAWDNNEWSDSRSSCVIPVEGDPVILHKRKKCIAIVKFLKRKLLIPIENHTLILNFVKIRSVKGKRFHSYQIKKNERKYQWLWSTEINWVMWWESISYASQQKCSGYKSAPSLQPQLKSWCVWRRRRRRRTRRRLSAVVMTTPPYREQ
jgi:hypothetical protein